MVHRIISNFSRLVSTSVLRRRTAGGGQATPRPAGGSGKTEEPAKGLETRSAVVVLVGIAVGILVGLSAGLGAGVVAGIASAAAVNGLLR